MAEDGKILKFCALESCVDPSFWSELASRKLDEYQLSEAAVPITGFLTASRHTEVPSQLQVLGSSFRGAGPFSAQGTHALPGELTNLNTIEGFKRADKKALLQQAAARVWSDVLSGAADADPSLLCRFLALAFGDLKKYVFTYWFAFPALKPPTPFLQLGARPLSEWLPDAAVEKIAAACDEWRGLLSAPQPGAAAPSPAAPPAPFFLLMLDPETPSAEALPLSAWAEASRAAGGAAGEGASSHRRLLVAMSDPSHLPLVPGWPLRNMLLLAAARWGARRLSVLCIRDARGRLDPVRSFVVDAKLPAMEVGGPPRTPEAAAAAPEAVGWEANAQGRLAPRRVDVSALMSPVALAEQAVDLNLRLMRWRAAPSLDIPSLSATRCLLLGAGTLGCAVARTLLAWGVRDITFVDSARVAFSNPVRQSLFSFQDCLGGGKPKAEAAAEALKAIFPSARARGVSMMIPMPGHPPEDEAAVARSDEQVRLLDDLISGHDVVFLLTDSRESRWLPTLLAAARRKVAVTAALGFDGFVVMRHGVPPAEAAAAADESPALSAAEPPQQQQQQQETQDRGDEAQDQERQQQPRSPAGPQGIAGRLGCYFCNDVVAPANSATDRTLDQQCTVARPGLAPIAGALAVEVVVALLQHPRGADAPAMPCGNGGGGGGDADASGAALGAVPHMIRGQLFGFGQVAMEGRAFSQCTACSDDVIRRWREGGPSFVTEALRRPAVLEEVTGLAELHRQAAAAAEAAAAAAEAAKAARAAAAGAGEGQEAGGGSEEDEEDWTEL